MNKILKIASFFLISAALVGCAANANQVKDVGVAEADRLPEIDRKLSTFAEFEIKPMTFVEAIESNPGKLKEGKDFEKALGVVLNPTLEKWNAAEIEGAAGKLGIQVHVQKLRIVSGGARWFGGAMAGNSFIDIDLMLIDEASGEEIAKERIRRDADAMAGSWSVGRSDQNLDAYLISIVHEYLKNNYN